MNYNKLTKAELIRILEMAEKSPINSPDSTLNYFDEYRTKQQEYFLVLTLNSAYKPIQLHEITKGLLNRALVHPREIFHAAIKDNAYAIIISHNHPSGNCVPSPEDDQVTTRIKQAGELMGIPLLDHIIVGGISHYSYSEHRKI